MHHCDRAMTCMAMTHVSENHIDHQSKVATAKPHNDVDRITRTKVITVMTHASGTHTSATETVTVRPYKAVITMTTY